MGKNLSAHKRSLCLQLEFDEEIPMPRRQVIAQHKRRATYRLSQGVDPRLWLGPCPVDFAHNAPFDLACFVYQQGGGENFDAQFLSQLALRVGYQGQCHSLALHKAKCTRRMLFHIDSDDHSLSGILQVRKYLKRWQLFLAGGAPSRPKVDDHFFAPQTFGRPYL